MSAQRKVTKLNNLLRDELGSPVRAWKITQDNCFVHPMPVFDSSGDPVYENVCSCGIDQRIHNPRCRLSRSRRKFRRRNILYDYEDPEQQRRMANRYLIAVESPLAAEQWRREYSSEPIPLGGLWYPLTNEGGYMMLDPGQAPDLDVTQFVIRAVRIFDKTGLNEIDRLYEERQEAVEKAKRARYGAALDSAVSVSLHPGTKGEVSLPATMRQLSARGGALIAPPRLSLIGTESGGST